MTGLKRYDHPVGQEVTVLYTPRRGMKLKATVVARHSSYHFVSWTEGDRLRTVQFNSTGRPLKVDERRYIMQDVWGS